MSTSGAIELAIIFMAFIFGGFWPGVIAIVIILWLEAS